MIKVEKVIINDKEFTKTYSSDGFKIKKVGTDEVYDEAIDVLDFEYEETDELVEVDNELELKAQAYDILVGEVE
jgi:hypothetical protein